MVGGSPSCFQAMHGATILFNLSASNEIIGKYEYRRELVSQQSARCIAGYVYSSSGIGESTTDLVLEDTVLYLSMEQFFPSLKDLPKTS